MNERTKNVISTPLTPAIKDLKNQLARTLTQFLLSAEESDGVNEIIIRQCGDRLTVIASELDYFYPDAQGLDSADIDAFLDSLSLNTRRLRELAQRVSPTDWLLEHQLLELSEHFRLLSPRLLVDLVREPTDPWADHTSSPKTPQLTA